MTKYAQSTSDESFSFNTYDAQGFEGLWQVLSDLNVTSKQLMRIKAKTAAALDIKVDSRLKDWRQVTNDLPSFVTEGPLSLIEPEFALPGRWSNLELATNTLQRLHPWRKGPIRLGDVYIDTEWRSDWKWSRALPHLPSLQGLRVLDIGCGNGYHCWRALGEGARLALGVDPTRLFHYQHRVFADLFNQYSNQEFSYPVHHLPLTLEDLDDTPLPYFDLVFSMGVLYHRRAPHEHLRSLQKHFALQGGTLLLETLITPNDEPLYPKGRYAQMRNVWCLPDITTLLEWLAEAGYQNARLVDLNQTTLTEQRQTPWMRFHSLTQALNPDDLNQTIEGHPAPLRAMVLAQFKGHT